MTSHSGPGDGRLTVEADGAGTALRIALRGEADVSSLEDLRSALAHIHLDGTRVVELDVSGLDFVDVAVLRHLTLFALGLKDTGHVVRTHGATPSLAHLIRLVGVDDQLGLDGQGPTGG